MVVVFRVLVRSRRDAGAVEATLKAFMPGWGVRVETLGGLRGERLADAILERLEPFTFVLLGREDSGVAEAVARGLPPLSSVVVTKGARVRNNRVEAIYRYIGEARARVRLAAYWSGGSYVFSTGFGGVELPGIPYLLRGDNFLLHGPGARVLTGVLSGGAGETPLLYRVEGGRHLVYSGPVLVGELDAGEDSPRPRGSRIPGAEPVSVPLERVVEANRPLLSLLERHVVEWLRSTAPDPDTVLVPWSGGKDSTAALLAAVEAYGRDGVVAVYADTGVDFPVNREYVERQASRLGVDLVVEHAGVDRELLAGRPLPTHGDRWCTGLKLEALRRAFRSATRGKAVIVTGDRDAESAGRYQRPPARSDEATGIPVLSPIKLWGGAHTQLYVLSKGVPLNPLYEAGFYRIGCYICFSLRGWELEVMERAGILAGILSRRPGHAGILRRFLEAKRRGLLRPGDAPCASAP
ncbi:phosphoadenosine phosphosulfate reductase domain-containing protein [Stetteria hydrogenophila]